MPPLNDEHNDDWIFDDAFPHASEYDVDRQQWRERNGDERTERESVGKLIVSKALQAFGVGKGNAA